MKNRVLVIRLARLLFFVGLNVVLLAYFFTQVSLPMPRLLTSVAEVLQIVPEGATPSAVLQRVAPNLSEDGLFTEITRVRETAEVPPVEYSATLADVAAMLLDEYAQREYQVENVNLDRELRAELEKIGYEYDWISHQVLVGPTRNELIAQAWLENPEQKQAVLNPVFSEVGLATRLVEENGQTFGVVVQLFAQPRVAQPTPTATSSRSGSSQLSMPEISDTEVITALNAYRQVHGLYPLQVNDNLCTYAEKRVQDLVANGSLDGHAGFKADFADPSNMPVGIRDYAGGSIGENLAHQYCKNMTTGESFVAQTGTALIEWCFDSSTKGHREAQLSKTFSNVCVRHGDHMYVVIFGE